MRAVPPSREPAARGVRHPPSPRPAAQPGASQLPSHPRNITFCFRNGESSSFRDPACCCFPPEPEGLGASSQDQPPGSRQSSCPSPRAAGTPRLALPGRILWAPQRRCPSSASWRLRSRAPCHVGTDSRSVKTVGVHRGLPGRKPSSRPIRGELVPSSGRSAGCSRPPRALGPSPRLTGGIATLGARATIFELCSQCESPISHRSLCFQPSNFTETRIPAMGSWRWSRGGISPPYLGTGCARR